MPNAWKREFNETVPFSKQDMLYDLVAFLGYDPTWTVLKATYNSGSTGDTGDPLVFQKSNGTGGDDVVVHLWESTSTNFGLNISTGPWNSGENWLGQPGARIGAEWPGTKQDYYTMTRYSSNEIYEYYFFGYEEYVYVVYRTQSGYWRNFAFGHIDKLCQFDGSGFCCASFTSNDAGFVDDANRGYSVQWFDMYGGSSQPDLTDRYHLSQIRMDMQNGDLRYACGMNQWQWESGEYTRLLGDNDVISSSGSPNVARNSQQDYYHGFEHDKMDRSPTDFSNVEVLIPIYIYSYRGPKPPDYPDLIPTFSLAGVLPHCFAMNIRNHNVGSEISIQGSTYIVFPTSKKTTQVDDNSGQPNSYEFGFVLEKLEA